MKRSTPQPTPVSTPSLQMEKNKNKLNGRLEEKKLTGGLKNYSTKQDKEKKLKKVRSIYNEKVPKHD